MQQWTGAAAAAASLEAAKDQAATKGQAGSEARAKTETPAPRKKSLSGTMVGLPGMAPPVSHDAEKSAKKGAKTDTKKGAKRDSKKNSKKGSEPGRDAAATERPRQSKHGDDPGASERKQRTTNPGPGAEAGVQRRPDASRQSHDVSAAPVQAVGPDMKLTSSERAMERITAPEAFAVPGAGEAAAATGGDSGIKGDSEGPTPGEDDNVYLEPERARAVLEGDPRYANFDRRPFRAAPDPQMARTVVTDRPRKPGRLTNDIALVAAGIGVIAGALWLSDQWAARDGSPPPVQTVAAGPSAAAAGQGVTELVTVPPGAEVVREGAVIASTPSSLANPEYPTDYLVRKTGFASQLVRLSATSPARIVLELQPAAANPDTDRAPAALEQP